MKSDISCLKENNEEIIKKYEEIKKNISSIGNETKETKKKRRIAIGIIIWLIISMYMNIYDDIKGIKNKIIREHGYGMIIETDEYIA